MEVVSGMFSAQSDGTCGWAVLADHRDLTTHRAKTANSSLQRTKSASGWAGLAPWLTVPVCTKAKWGSGELDSLVVWWAEPSSQPSSMAGLRHSKMGPQQEMQCQPAGGHQWWQLGRCVTDLGWGTRSRSLQVIENKLQADVHPVFL